jgi:uridine kinase
VPAVIESYPELARRVMARPPRLGHSRLVAVDGPSGAGKSVFAGRLAAALAGHLDPGKPPVVHTDDLLDGWADQFTFWPRLDWWVLDPLRHGQPGRYRRYNWVRQRFTARWITVPPAPVVIIEGVSSARAAIAPELSMAVFVTAPPALRQARTTERDGPAVQPYLETWRVGERAYFAADRTAERANLLVDGAAELVAERRNHYVRLR